MKVKTEITPHRINGDLHKVGDERKLLIENVWNQNKMVALIFPEGVNVIEVHYDDLRKAMDNAVGNERF